MIYTLQHYRVDATLAQRQTTRQQNNRIPPKFHRISQKNPAHQRKLPLTTSAETIHQNGRSDPNADAKPDQGIAATVTLYLRYNALPDCKIRRWIDCELNQILYVNNHVFLRK